MNESVTLTFNPVPSPAGEWVAHGASGAPLYTGPLWRCIEWAITTNHPYHIIHPRRNEHQ